MSHKPPQSRSHLSFIVIAILLMVLADRFIFNSTRPYIEAERQESIEKSLEELAALNAIQSDAVSVTPDVLSDMPSIESTTQTIEPEISETTLEPASAEASVEQHSEVIESMEPPKMISLVTDEKITPPDMGLQSAYDKDAKRWEKNAVPFVAPEDKPRVIIMIDDVGIARGYSRDVLNLQGPLTLAFLPYAKDVDEMAADARKAGHEIMIHMPMEPMNPDLDTGTIALRTEASPKEFDSMLDAAFKSLEGYVGINNHMGSRLTQDQKAMDRLMARLAKEELLFVDSRTIHSSVAAETARSHQVPYAIRDVFLDHDPSKEGVRRSLEQLERIARRYGHAIAIGHPKPETIAVLKEWLPSLEGKGLVLAPISSVIIKPGEKHRSETVVSIKNNVVKAEPVKTVVNKDKVEPQVSVKNEMKQKKPKAKTLSAAALLAAPARSQQQSPQPE